MGLIQIFLKKLHLEMYIVKRVQGMDNFVSLILNLK